MRRLIIMCCGALFTLGLTAQQELPGNRNIYDAKDIGIIYNHELTFNVALATPRNFFLGVRSGKLLTYDKTRYWTLSIGDIRHSRERRENPDRVNVISNRVSRAYVFGKQNQLYALRLGFGMKKFLSEKARERGVAIGYSYEFGPSLGLLKPYYLEIERNDAAPIDVRFTGDNLDVFINNQTNIFGASAWTVGLDEIGLRPGVHAKFATHFGFGAYDETAKSLEAGIMADYFLGNTDIMVESELTPGVSNSPLFLSLFLNFQIGKRW
ncbi:hypothetical protein GGR28_000100 [Lewinella aquimaris]|uniref:Uncharacterized protein n=1 Tax=Neolewinella aquimaris TaxID=1835722 RepID=A0A840E6S8_9BACT|nr:hypothetical protein [Neolewinella aquimaris]MBB4077499.1 hypothetical protein [Neolewinella aquimaris]